MEPPMGIPIGKIHEHLQGVSMMCAQRVSWNPHGMPKGLPNVLLFIQIVFSFICMFWGVPVETPMETFMRTPMGSCMKTS